MNYFLFMIRLNMQKLRYTAELDWVHPEDKGRQFVIEYRLSDGYIKITELRMENSGHTGGGFLKFVLVPKEGCDPNMPEYVTPRDFVLGNVILHLNPPKCYFTRTIIINSHSFILLLNFKPFCRRSNINIWPSFYHHGYGCGSLPVHGG